jgi:NADPH:quinone reductase-like Zn-dependent oxidoreductase
LTSWQAIFDTANLQDGQRILITGASGGVGSMAVQLAKAKGAFVIATASGKNEEFVRSLGADEFVDYTREKFEERVREVDVVYDTVGGDTLERSFETLRRGGCLVTTVTRSVVAVSGKVAAILATSNRPASMVVWFILVCRQKWL